MRAYLMQGHLRAREVVVRADGCRRCTVDGRMETKVATVRFPRLATKAGRQADAREQLQSASERDMALRCSDAQTHLLVMARRPASR